MRYFLALISILFLVSCGTYRVQVRQPQLQTVLGVTTQGDTIQVPMDYFDDIITPRYNYNLEYLYWGDSWWLYNQNLYNRWWWNNQPYWRPRPNHIIIPRNKSKIQGRRSIPQIQPNRGRSNQSQVRRPQYNRGTPPPTASNRNSTVRRSNNNVRKQN